MTTVPIKPFKKGLGPIFRLGLPTFTDAVGRLRNSGTRSQSNTHFHHFRLPRSDPIRLNNFSLALSLIGFFLYGLPGQFFLSQVCPRTKLIGWQCPNCGSILSGASDLDQSSAFDPGHLTWTRTNDLGPGHPTGGVLHVTRCLGLVT